MAFQTRDHRADEQKECRRVLDAGGIVENGRIGGVQPSRVFGDVEVKEAREGVGLIAVPEVCEYEGMKPMLFGFICLCVGVPDRRSAR